MVAGRKSGQVQTLLSCDDGLHGSCESAVGVQVGGGTWTKCLYTRVVRRLRPCGAEVSGAAKSVDQIPMANPETGPWSQAITRPTARSAARADSDQEDPARLVHPPDVAADRGGGAPGPACPEREQDERKLHLSSLGLTLQRPVARIDALVGRGSREGCTAPKLVHLPRRASGVVLLVEEVSCQVERRPPIGGHHGRSA
jgi:hypothetical protein